LGNHDIVTNNGSPELDEPAFGMQRRNYVVRASGVRFVFANSNGIRKKWLRPGDQGGGRRQLDGCLVSPSCYSPGEHGSTPGFADWMPSLFDRRGVDLVLNGHDHLYAVSRKLDGIRYVVTGGGGASLYDCREHSLFVKCKERYHFLHVTDERLVVRAVPPKGAPFHKFTTKGNP
jgi:hypothetical protein